MQDLRDETLIRSSAHRSALISHLKHNLPHRALDSELLERLASIRVSVDFRTTGDEGLVAIGAAVDAEVDCSKVGGAAEGDPIGETCAADSDPERTFDGAEVGVCYQ
jgi:hypothetical protein